MMYSKYLRSACFVLVVSLVSVQAYATPGFARSTGVTCTGCHTAYPSLNALGRDFKTQGYRMMDGAAAPKATDFPRDVHRFPISAAVVSRPYVKEKGSNVETRAIHKFEIMVGGVFYKNISGFIEMEAEDEDGFGVVLAHAAVNYDVSHNLHVQAAFGPTFFADPYDTLSDMRRLTAAHYNITNDTFGDADNSDKMRHSRQQVSLFGRVFGDKIFYNVGIGGLTEDKVGNKSNVGFGRLAMDVTPNAMVGVFGVQGKCDVTMESDFADCQGSANDLSFSRLGLDTQIDVGALRLTGVFLQAKDDVVNSSESQSNSDAYVQMTYFGQYGNKQIVPLLRYQSSEMNDGNDRTYRALVAVAYYPQTNFRASIEYADDTSTPAGVSKRSNLTLQFVAAF